MRIVLSVPLRCVEEKVYELLLSVLLFLTLCIGPVFAQETAENPASTASSKAAPSAASGSAEPAAYSEERPANFVFIVDVSGSIVSPRTQVRAADGSTITLFEALRQALKQIVQDDRLLAAKSKIAFITFGTAITEKSEWPASLAGAEERNLLLSKIASPTELQADKHGDTYMAGGLHAAYARAEEFAKTSEPCTTTFILMLTDGWDEPPAGAQYNIAEESARFQKKAQELKKKLGVNTWQLRVIGLQRLPDKKAGTTTAAELARMLGGEFLDVSKSQTGTVAERIYAALKQTIADLRGSVDLPALESSEGIIDFGRITETPSAKRSLKVWNRSCYVEKLTQVTEVCARQKSAELLRMRNACLQAANAGRFPDLPDKGKSLVLTSALAPGAIRLQLAQSEYLLAPVEREGENQGQPSGAIEVVANVGSSCPPGAYLGVMGFQSSAKIPGVVPYLLTVPSRLTVEQEKVKVQVRKPGFIFNKDTVTELDFRVGAKVNSSYASEFDVSVLASEGSRQLASTEKEHAAAQLSSNLIHDGEAASIRVNSADAQGTPVKLEVHIPADLVAGNYAGKIAVKCKEHNELVADTSVPYLIEVLPSPWDEMSPIAIPVAAIFLLVCLIAGYMAIVGNRDRI